MNRDDQQLADFIEGLLPEPERRALEAELEQDAALRSRLSELQSFFGDQGALGTVEVPETLVETTLLALEEEGLVHPEPWPELDVSAVPAGLVETTMNRLEEEGLVKPARPLFIFDARFLRLAAALLLFLGLGFVLGSLSAAWSADSQSRVVPEGEWEALQATLSRLRKNEEAARESIQKLTEVATRARSLELDLSASQARVKSLEQERGGLRASVSKLRRADQSLREQLARITEELEAERSRSREIDPGPEDLAQLKARHVVEMEGLKKQLRGELDDAKKKWELSKGALTQALSEKERALLAGSGKVEELEGQLAALKENKQVAGMIVKDAERVDYWDNGWFPVLPGSKFARGTLFRAESSRSSLRLEKRSIRLVNGLFQVRGQNRLARISLEGERPSVDVIATRDDSNDRLTRSREGRVDPIRGILNRFRDQ